MDSLLLSIEECDVAARTTIVRDMLESYEVQMVAACHTDEDRAKERGRLRDAEATGLDWYDFPVLTDSLIQASTDSDESIRQKAVSLLGCRSGRGIVSALHARTIDAAEAVRNAAWEALFRRSDSETAVVMLDLLGTCPVTDFAICWRELLNSPSAEDEAPGTVAYRAFKFVRSSRAPRLKQILLDRLESNSPVARHVSILLLTTFFGDLTAYKAVGRALSDDNWHVRMAAVLAMGGVDKFRNCDWLLKALGDAALIDDFVSIIPSSSTRPYRSPYPVSQAAIEIVRKFATPDVVATLFSVPVDSPCLEAALIRLAGELTRADVVFRCTAGNHSPDATVRRAAVETLVTTIDPDAVALLHAAARSSDSHARVVAIEAFLLRTDLTDTEAVIAGLVDTEVDVASAAARVLALDAIPGGRAVLLQWIENLFLSEPPRWSQLSSVELVVLIEAVIHAKEECSCKTDIAASLLLAANNHDNEELSQRIVRSLGQLPLLWFAAAIPLCTPYFRMPLRVETVRILALCGDPVTARLLGSTFVDSSTPNERTLLALRGYIRAEPAACLPALLRVIDDHRADQVFLESAIGALPVLGPSSWHQMREAFHNRNSSLRLKAALLNALGMAGDGQVSGLLLRSLDDRSQEIRQSAARGIENLGDLITADIPIASLSMNGRAYVELMLSLMKGEPMPESTDLVRTWADAPEEAQATPLQFLTPQGDEIAVTTFREHVHEFGRRLVKPFLPAVGAALVGSGLCWIFPDTTAMVVGSLAAHDQSTAMFDHQLVPLIAAAWVGLPLMVFHLWQFIGIGLYPYERRLFQPFVDTVVSVMLVIPLLATVVTLALGGISRNLLPTGAFQAETMQWIANRLSMLAVIVIVWSIGLRPLWSWVALWERAKSVLKLAGSSEDEEPLINSPRTLLAILAVSTIVIGLLLPIYLIVSMLLSIVWLFGVIGVAAMAGAALKRPFMISHLEVSASLGRAWLRTGLISPIVSAVIVVLQYTLSSAATTSSWLRPMMAAEFPTASFVYLVVVLSLLVWQGAAVLISLATLFRSQWSRRANEPAKTVWLINSYQIAATLLPLGIFAVVDQVAMRLIDDNSARWLAIRLAIVSPAILMAVFVSHGINDKIPFAHRLRIVALILGLTAVPALIVACAMLLPGLVLVASLPAILHVFISRGPKRVISAMRKFLQEGRTSLDDPLGV